MRVYEQRRYQQEAVQECVRAFADAGKASVMLTSPVGSGKTYMALETVHRLQVRLGRPLRVGWVAPRHHLLDQMAEANGELYRDDIRAVSLFERNPPEVDMVVLDEAHHEATQSCVLLYEKMKPQWVLGLSATPLRTDRMKLSFQETVKTCSIARLIREGYLSRFDSYLMPHYTPAAVAEHYLASPERWGKSLVYFHTIADCVEFRQRMAEGGIEVEVVTAETDKDRQLARFLEGKVHVIANVGMLTEGFDSPDVKSVFARDASRLPTIQMCGRGLRTAPGKEVCNIIQSEGTKYLFEKVAPARNLYRFQENRWLALTDKTEEIEATLKRTLELVALRRKQ